MTQTLGIAMRQDCCEEDTGFVLWEAVAGEKQFNLTLGQHIMTSSIPAQPLFLGCNECLTPSSVASKNRLSNRNGHNLSCIQTACPNVRYVSSKYTRAKSGNY